MNSDGQSCFSSLSTNVKTCQFDVSAHGKLLKNMVAILLVVILAGCGRNKEGQTDTRDPICIIPPSVLIDDLAEGREITSIVQVCEFNERKLPARVVWRAMVGSEEIEREILRINYIKNEANYWEANLCIRSAIEDGEAQTELVIKTHSWHGETGLPNWEAVHEIVLGDLIFKKFGAKLLSTSDKGRGHSAFDPNSSYTSLFVQEGTRRYLVIRRSAVFTGSGAYRQLPSIIKFDGTVPDHAKHAHTAWLGHVRMDIIEEGEYARESESQITLKPVWTIK